MVPILKKFTIFFKSVILFSIKLATFAADRQRRWMCWQTLASCFFAVFPVSDKKNAL